MQRVDVRRGSVRAIGVATKHDGPRLRAPAHGRRLAPEVIRDPQRCARWGHGLHDVELVAIGAGDIAAPSINSEPHPTHDNGTRPNVHVAIIIDQRCCIKALARRGGSGNVPLDGPRGRVNRQQHAGRGVEIHGAFVGGQRRCQRGAAKTAAAGEAHSPSDGTIGTVQAVAIRLRELRTTSPDVDVLASYRTHNAMVRATRQCMRALLHTSAESMIKLPPIPTVTCWDHTVDTSAPCDAEIEYGLCPAC